ncbi:MAG: TonB-dependent receptor [Gemmatimonadota bacterium]|nr:TonB-dependent receptor [Gemmatimonadota bacterium]
MSGGVSVPLGTSFAFTARGGGRNLGDVHTGGGDRLDNSYSKNLNGVAGLGYFVERATAGVAYRGFGFDYGLPAGHGHGHDEHEDEDEHQEEEAEEGGVHIEGSRHDVVGRVDFTLGQGGGAFTYLRLDGTAQRYTHDEIEPSGEIGTTFKLNTQTVNATARTRFGRMIGAIGASGLFRQYRPEGEEALTPPATSSSGGLFVFQELLLGRDTAPDAHIPRLQLGGRYDTYRIETEPGGARFEGVGPRTRTFGSVSGSLGLNVPIGEATTVGVSVARAFRAPTVEELYSNAFHAALGSFDRGNADLEAETNQGADAILRTQSGSVTAQLAGFYNRIDDYITPDIVKDTTIVDEHDGDVITVPLNVFAQRDATLRGLEGQVEARVTRRVVVGAMGDVVRGRFVGGAPIPFMPAARVGGSLRWDDGRWSFGGTARHAFAQDLAAEREARNEHATDAYTVFGLDAGLTFIAAHRVHSVTLRADNVLDEEYREATSRIKEVVANPGRNVTVVYKLLF